MGVGDGLRPTIQSGILQVADAAESILPCGYTIGKAGKFDKPDIQEQRDNN